MLVNIGMFLKIAAEKFYSAGNGNIKRNISTHGEELLNFFVIVNFLFWHLNYAPF